MVGYGRGHGTRETCALHTARLSCDTLVDFWSALGEETRQSLLRMKEEDFIERLMYRCLVIRLSFLFGSSCKSVEFKVWIVDPVIVGTLILMLILGWSPS